MYKEHDAALKDLNEETNGLYDVAKELTDGVTPTNKEAFNAYYVAFGKLPNSLPEIEELVENTSTRIYVGKDKDTPDAENIIREHERKAAEIEKYTEELAIMNAELSKNYEETEKVKALWLPPLTALVDRICANFSGYLEKLACAGEVKLVPGENPNDFADYALKIMVKFRAAEPLQEFTKSRQSGGETSLTTAMYMIALQEMSQVPFR